MLNKFRLFYAYVSDLLADARVQSMARIEHHTQRISCLDHCLFVSYVSFALSRFFGGNERAVTRAGLLHDLYLCNWKKERSLYRHLLIHPDMAAENARAFGISKLEEGIIRKHMWPVTISRLPRRREELIVNLADKICAVSEVKGIYWLIRLPRRLAALRHRPVQA